MVIVTAQAAACATNTSEPTPSTEIATSQLSFAITARSDGRVTQVVAAFFGVLTEPDHLYARTPGDAEVSLVSLGAGEWVAQFRDAPSSVVVGLGREGGARTETTLDLPAAFALKPIAAPASRKTPIVLEWDTSAAGDSVAITIDVVGDCIEHVHRALAADTGTFTLQSADFFAVGAPASCTLTASVTRTLHPTAAWSATPSPTASLTTEQTRDVSFLSTP